MSDKSDARARWIGGASLLVMLAALLVLAARTPGAPEEQAPEAAAEAAICEAGRAHTVDVNGEIEELMQDTRSRLEQAGTTDGDLVVLNNRGFNYGGAPNVRLDSFLVEVER